MDHADHDRSRTLIDSLQNRIRLISGGFTKRYRLALPSDSLIRKLKAGVLLCSALVLGLLAHRLNDREAELRWKKSHLPSARIWSSSMGSEGFRPVANPSWIARISRNLPTLSDGMGRIWKAAPDWWAVEGTDASAPLIFCLECDFKKTPSSWSNIGSGWDGWDESMKEARFEAIEAAKHRPKPRIMAEKADPREIRY